jgi:hypothetical protein
MRVFLRRLDVRDEHGGILVMAAVMIPVFLLLTALVVDVGNWYAHKRQLQNRADAAAFAAGVEYAKSWKACVGSDATVRTTTARRIADAARRYAGNPEAADYAGGSLPGTLYNTDVANQTNVDVVINSGNADYNDDTDFTDGGALDVADPCFNHAGDDISPGGGQWTDVRVKERNLPSLFRALGLSLSRNGARARVEIRPSIAGHKFLPLAVPNTIVTRVQVRYYDECRNQLLATRDLAPLPEADQAGFAAAGGGTLWGLPSAGDPKVGDRSLSFALTVPSYGGCGQAYLPVGVEVRLASRDEVDFNQTCNQLASASFADCFHRVSQFRVWNDGNPNSQVRIGDVYLTGGCGNTDAYFGTLPLGSTDCRFGADVYVNWGNRDDGNLAVPANFTVTINGTAATLSGNLGDAGGQSLYTVPAGTLTADPGANDVTVAVSWSDRNTTHEYPIGSGNKCKSNGGAPCNYSGTEPTHRAYVGTDKLNDASYTGALGFVRTSQSGFVSGLPGPPFTNVRTGGATGNPASPVQIYPTVGTVSPLKTGVLTTLRIDDSQGTGLLRCDPDYTNGQAFDGFLNGCKPWYAENTFSSPWWNTGTQSCPSTGQWFSYGTNPAPFGKNASGNPWQCVPTIPGGKTGQVGDWMAVATDNCSNIHNNSCGNISCLVDGNYDGKPGKPNGWLQNGGDSSDPRVIDLFVVPYQALKNAQGSGDPIPILGFASFYVMDWGGVNKDDDPCPDRTYGNVTIPEPAKRSITGVYVEKVEYEPGPVDPTATCVEGQLTPCRVTLVR